MTKVTLRLPYTCLLLCLTLTVNADTIFPVFDAHIHYNDDVWEAIPPKVAIQRMRDTGIIRATVSSSSDDGTQMLFQADPTFVIPALRPYRTRGMNGTWMHDDSVIPYLKDRLARYHYVAIGELHLQGEQADSPVMRQVVQLARKYKLMLHVHSDADAIKRIFQQDSQAQILWAHAGFEYAYVVRKLLQEQENLWADLSFRREIYTNGKFLQDWRELLIDFAEHFMLGIDTYTPERWLQIDNEMRWQQELLNALPEAVAKKIAYENGERVISARFMIK